eukprot:TRINITY_DN53969_c0_g1_i1.p1 TRINITY_DN53969_c0_g1~~TRINITY_DN53969_c0_g1_i1.p1  ORF type:complete len:709 (-),score=88.85 TRINITY_DN53969_c0_g1_i1:36-2000(-)
MDIHTSDENYDDTAPQQNNATSSATGGGGRGEGGGGRSRLSTSANMTEGLLDRTPTPSSPSHQEMSQFEPTHFSSRASITNPKASPVAVSPTRSASPLLPLRQTGEGGGGGMNPPSHSSSSSSARQLHQARRRKRGQEVSSSAEEDLLMEAYWQAQEQREAEQARKWTHGTSITATELAKQATTAVGQQHQQHQPRRHGGGNTYRQQRHKEDSNTGDLIADERQAHYSASENHSSQHETGNSRHHHACNQSLDTLNTKMPVVDAIRNARQSNIAVAEEQTSQSTEPATRRRSNNRGKGEVVLAGCTRRAYEEPPFEDDYLDFSHIRETWEKRIRNEQQEENRTISPLAQPDHPDSLTTTNYGPFSSTQPPAVSASSVAVLGGTATLGDYGFDEPSDPPVDLTAEEKTQKLIDAITSEDVSEYEICERYQELKRKDASRMTQLNMHTEQPREVFEQKESPHKTYRVTSVAHSTKEPLQIPPVPAATRNLTSPTHHNRQPHQPVHQHCFSGMGTNAEYQQEHSVQHTLSQPTPANQFSPRSHESDNENTRKQHSSPVHSTTASPSHQGQTTSYRTSGFHKEAPAAQLQHARKEAHQQQQELQAITTQRMLGRIAVQCRQLVSAEIEARIMVKDDEREERSRLCTTEVMAHGQMGRY